MKDFLDSLVYGLVEATKQHCINEATVALRDCIHEWKNPQTQISVTQTKTPKRTKATKKQKNSRQSKAQVKRVREEVRRDDNDIIEAEWEEVKAC